MRLRLRQASLTGLIVAVLPVPAEASAPLPPSRPVEAGIPARPSAEPKEEPAAPAVGAAPASPAPACLDELRAAGATAAPAPQSVVPNQACVIETPIRLTAMAGQPGASQSVAFPDEPLVDCRLGLALAGWVSGIAAPVLAAGQGAPLKAIRTGPGFECRSRNHQPGAKLSAHGSGLALDIAGFEFTDGSRASLGPAMPPRLAPSFAAIRRGACGWFTTVLGPGSDASHTDHLHLDVQLHGSTDRYRICQ